MLNSETVSHPWRVQKTRESEVLLWGHVCRKYGATRAPEKVPVDGISGSELSDLSLADVIFILFGTFTDWCGRSWFFPGWKRRGDVALDGKRQRRVDGDTWSKAGDARLQGLQVERKSNSFAEVFVVFALADKVLREETGRTVTFIIRTDSSGRKSAGLTSLSGFIAIDLWLEMDRLSIKRST